MILQVGKRCVGCGACVACCPSHCLSFERHSDGFLYPDVDTARCLDCGLCDKSCPVLEKKHKDSTIKKAFAVQASDCDIVEKSSSGGMFYLLASDVLKKGGYVCGVEVDAKNKIRHAIVDDLENLNRLFGSKYVQSEVGDVYISIKKLLESGKIVLFSGTPCQVSGLKAFLNKDYNNLLTVDVICHGVPSPYAWEKYLELQEKKFGSKIVGVNFRKKTTSWKNYGMELRFANGDIYFEPGRNDAYLIQFFENLCLRETCYSCEFKGANRSSDITIGDFWGKDEVCPELAGERGLSLVIVNTSKGQDAFNTTEHSRSSREVETTKALKYNGAYWDSVKKPRYRDGFIKDLAKKPFDKATYKYVRKIARERKILFYIRKIKKIIKK